ncbi:MAG: hypothetical protein K2V38_19780 [Gemmataceae bacterium]|nr:hypothetical protein [Gemmataceae bacterium]
MPRLLIAVAVVGLTALPGCRKPVEYTSQQYKFSAVFPGTPKETDQTTAGVKVKMFAVESRNGMCGVAVSDMPIPAGEPADVTQGRLDGARDGAVRNVGGALKTSSPVTLGGHPGREFTATITSPAAGFLRSRVYLVGTRMYQVVVVGTESYANSAECTNFLNSLKLLD